MRKQLSKVQKKGQATIQQDNTISVHVNGQTSVVKKLFGAFKSAQQSTVDFTVHRTDFIEHLGTEKSS